MRSSYTGSSSLLALVFAAVLATLAGAQEVGPPDPAAATEIAGQDAALTERLRSIFAAPSARIAALGDSTVQLELYGWVDQRDASYGQAASEAQRLVKATYDQAGIAMPAPEYLVQPEAPVPAPLLEGRPSERIDLSTADDVTKQVEEEIERSAEGNLLADPDATFPRSTGAG